MGGAKKVDSTRDSDGAAQGSGGALNLLSWIFNAI
jgi:hypothetical protein